MATQASSDHQSHSQISSASSLFGQNVAAFLLGAVILFAVGFAPMSSAHNAAHDTRHALAFPCH
jgi:cobalt transporter subunit CbtB